jgi:hypothetical protein
MDELSSQDEEEWSNLISSLSGDVEELSRRLNVVAGIVEQALGQAASATEASDTLAASLLSPIQQLRVQADEAQSVLDGVYDDAIGTLTNVSELFKAVEEDTSPMFEFVNAIEDAAETVRVEMKAAVEELLEQQTDKLEANVLAEFEELEGRISSSFMEAAEETIGKIEDLIDKAVAETLQPIVHDLTESVDSLFEEIKDRIARGDEETSQENLALKPIVDALRPPVEQLISEVERVTSLAAGI